MVAMKKNAKSRGWRPLKGDQRLMVPISIRFPPAMMEAIRKLQAERLDSPELGAIVRELLAKALTAEQNSK